MTVLVSSNLFFAWKAKNNGVTSAGSRQIIDMLCISGLRNGVMTFSSRTMKNEFGMAQTTRHRALSALSEAGVIEVDMRYDEITGRQTTNSIRFVPATHEEMLEYVAYLASLGEQKLVVFYERDGKRLSVSGWHPSWIAEDVQDVYQAERVSRGGVVGLRGYVPGERTPSTRSELDEALSSKKETRLPENGEPLVGGMAPLRGRESKNNRPTERLAPLGARASQSARHSAREIHEGGGVVKGGSVTRRSGSKPPPIPRDARKPDVMETLHDTEGIPTPEMTLDSAYGEYDPATVRDFNDVFSIDLESRKIAEEISPGSSMMMKLPPRDPREIAVLRKKIAWLGGAKKALAYLKFLMKQGLDWISGFGWTDIDLYAIFCFGAIKEWRYTLRIEQGKTTQRSTPRRLTAAVRASVDEWSDDGSEYAW